MYKHILVPLGLSELNPVVLDKAVELVSTDQAKVTLMHVVQAFDSETDEETERFYKEIEHKAEHHLQKAGELMLQKGVSSNHIISIGDKAAEVLRYIEAEAVDLIVIESHQIDKNKPMEGLGSFSHQIAVLSPCSVLLVR